LCTRDRCIDIFKDVKMKKDDFEKLHKQMNNHISYKFMKTKKELIFNRLDVILKTNMLQGPQYIIVLIQRIKTLKELFVLDLEQGHEVHIPDSLSQRNLPYSFRYYDPII
jgi:hypothetical protein